MVDVLFDVKISLTFLNEFTLRAVWGVSPRSINQKRDLKTVINVQNVSFSGYDNEEKGKNFQKKFWSKNFVKLKGVY